MKKIVIYLILCTFLSIMIVVSLVIANAQKSLERGGFERTFTNEDMTFIKRIDLNAPLYRICGATEQNFYFIGKAINTIFKSDLKLDQWDSILLPIPLDNRITASFDLNIEPPNIELYTGNLASKITWKIGDSTFTISKLNAPLFTKAASISKSTAIIKAFDSTQQKQSLKKFNTQNGEIISESDILEDRNDAGFTTEGMIRYDTVRNLVIFAQYYQNNFFCLDTNLNLKYRSSTIDTINNSNTTIKSFIGENNKGSLMSSSPLRVINKECTIHGEYIYIISDIRSENEDANDFNNNTAIDKYSIEDGKYKESFYLPNIEKRKVRSIRFSRNYMVALYTNYLALYKLNFD